MKKVLRKFFPPLAIIFFIAISASCATAPASVKPTDTTPVASSTIKIIDIVGIQEWKPLQESTLICAIDSSSETALKYIWSAEQGVISGDGQEVKWVAPETPGSYRVTVQVFNGNGEGTTFSRSFEVTTNPYNSETPDTTIYLKLSLPSITVVEAAARVRSQTAAEIECVVDGISIEELTYQWTAPVGRLNGNGLKEGKASRVAWYPPGGEGTCTVSVTVSDKSGNSASGQVNFKYKCCGPL